MKMFSVFLLALCFIAIDASVSEARCGRGLFSGMRARHAARVEHRQDRRSERPAILHLRVRVQTSGCQAELIPAPQEVKAETRLANNE